jgi:energy-dependent translational throttle protein EttA
VHRVEAESDMVLAKGLRNAFGDKLLFENLAFEGDSETVWFEGNYGSYIEDLKRRKGPDADQPHRIKYEKLVR